MEQWIVCVLQKICHNGCLETSHVMKHPIYIAIQLLVDWTAYQLPVLVNKYLEFSMVNGFVSAIFIKTINCVGEPLDRHLKNNAVGPSFIGFYAGIVAFSVVLLAATKRFYTNNGFQ